MKFTITDTIFGKSYEIKGKEELRDWIVNLVVGHSGCGAGFDDGYTVSKSSTIDELIEAFEHYTNRYKIKRGWNK